MAAALRAVFSKTKPWWSGQGNRLVKRKLSLVLGVVGCSTNSSSIVNGSKDLTLSPEPFNLTFRRCFSEPAPLSRLNNDPGFSNYQLTPVPCSIEDKGVVYAAHYAVATYGYNYSYYCFAYEPFIPIRLVRVVSASVIRIGCSIYSLTLEGIPESGDLNLYHAIVLHDPVKKLKKVFSWKQLVNEYPSRQLDSLENSRFSSAVASDVIVPIDIEDDEQIHKCALSAVETSSEKDKKICLEKVLCASKSEVGDSVCYFLLLRAKDDNEDSSTYCAIIKVLWFEKEKRHEKNTFMSKPLQDYQVGLGA